MVFICNQVGQPQCSLYWMLDMQMAVACSTDSGYLISITNVSSSILPKIRLSYHYRPPRMKFLTEAFLTIPLKSSL